MTLDPHAAASLGVRVRTLRPHQTMALNDPSWAWIVRSGSGEIFSSMTKSDRPVGRRRFCFRVSEGETILPAKPEEKDSPTCLTLLAVKELTLLEIPIERLEEVCRATGIDLFRSIERWVNRLSASAADGSPPGTAERISAEERRALDTAATVCSERAVVAWVRVEEGAASLMGIPEMRIGPGTAHFPLGSEIWLEATEPLELVAVRSETLYASGGLTEALFLFHTLLLQRFDQQAAEDRDAEMSRLEQRAAGQQRVVREALDAMASVLSPGDRITERDSALLSAVGLVGEAIGVEIRPPVASNDAKRMRDPLRAIARASRLHYRRVLLDWEWWKRDCGPLVAYLSEGNRPVALLNTGSRYEIVDPESGSRTPVDARSYELLAPEAAMFYSRLPNDVTSPLRLVRFALRGRGTDIAFVIGLSALITLLGMLTPQAMAVVMDSAIPDSNEGLLVELGLALVAIAFGASLLGLAQGLVAIRLAIGSDATTQSAVWDRLLKLRVAFFKRYSAGDLLDRATAVHSVTQELSGATLMSLLTGLASLLNLGLLFYYSAQLAVMVCLLAGIVALVTITAGYFLRKYTRILMELQGKFFGLVVQLVGAVGKIRVAGAQRHAFALWANRYTEQIKIMLEAQKIDDYVTVVNQVVPLVSTMVLFWFGVSLLSQTESGGVATLSVGVFLAFNVAMGTFLHGATSLSNTIVDVLDTLVESERIQPILEAEQESDEAKTDPGQLKGALSLSHIDFRYLEDGPRILDDLSIEVNSGEFVALVGPSGSGKSTIFRLLLGFESPEAGTIFFDGHDLGGLDVAAVRREMGVVLQTAHIEAGSIFDNIAGNSVVTLGEAWDAAEDAGLADEIRELPMQLQTMVSEGGTNFSGGQIQRLLIARALVTNPRILLMDEATSALDNRSQAIVSRSLERRNVTRLVIAHRLSTIQKAHRIYVLDEGRVVEHGSFAELTRAKGLFASLMSRQLR